MTREEYLSAIPNEISDFLPIPITDVYFDFQILVSHPDEPLNDILVVATPKRLVDDYVEMAELADLELVALETKPLAVGRAIIGDEDKSGSLIIHLGKEYSRIAIWDDGNLKLTTTVNIGQNQLLESLGYVGKVDKKEIKLTTANEKDISIPLNTIIDEVINVIKYHLNRSYKPKPISHIMLCGSGISINGLDLLIEKEVKIKTTIKKIKLKNKESLPPQYIVAFGLAQRKEEE
jgi:type IV pilus assembly protein PilM